MRFLWRVTCHQLVHCRYVDGATVLSQDVDFVTDGNLWILYADRQGCIQSKGFNFIRDLPTFFVLLYALQRFTLTEWGLNPDLDGRVKQAHGVGLINNSQGLTHEPNNWITVIGRTPITLGRKKLHSALAMTGRGTLAVEGFATNAGQRRKVALKMYWPEASPERTLFYSRCASGCQRGLRHHKPSAYNLGLP